MIKKSSTNKQKTSTAIDNTDRIALVFFDWKNVGLPTNHVDSTKLKIEEIKQAFAQLYTWMAKNSRLFACSFDTKLVLRVVAKLPY